MASGKATIVKNDFSGGQVDATAKRRDDTELLRSACKSALNMRLISGGGAKFRPGRVRQAAYAPVVPRRVLTVRPTPNLTFRMVFTAGAVAIYRADKTLHTTLAVAPWTAPQLPAISLQEVEQSVFVAHQQFRPQVLKYDVPTDTWSRTPFAFQDDLNHELRQPYFRFAPDGVTMRPSALTGAITVTFSAPTLLPGHVGTRFRFVDREVLITAVTSSTVGAATVIDELPPTVQANVKTAGTTAGFSIGDVVEGLDSGAKGEVVAKGTLTLDVVLYATYDGFEGGEFVVGPHGRQKLLGDPMTDPPPAPGAAIRWDEQFMSDVRGWPGRVDYDLRRVIFSDFRQKPEAIVWSEISYAMAFRVSGLATGGLFELVPNNCRVLAVVGGSDEFIITDRGVYYVPISESDPLKPGSVAFRLIDSVGAAAVSPAQMSEGVVFVAEGQARVLAIVPTGQTAKPYLVRDLTEFHSRLLKTPVCLAATKGSPDMPERYLYVQNADGSVVVGKFDASRDWVGFLPWRSVGAVVDMSGSQEDLTLIVNYDGFTLIEAMESTALLDAETPGADRTALQLFAGKTVKARDANGYRGAFVVDGAGALVGYPENQDLATVGFDFDARLDPWIPNVQGGEADGRRQTKRRVARVAVHVVDSNGYRAGGRIIAPYQLIDDGGSAPPLRERTYRFRRLGRSDDAGFPIERLYPGLLTVLELTVEATV